MKGTKASLFYVQCLLYLVSSSISVSIFHSTRLDIFWTALIYVLVSNPSTLILHSLKVTKHILTARGHFQRNMENRQDLSAHD